MKNTFPADFTWGVATSSYQIEGGHDQGGKGPSIWDAFSSIPGKIKDGTTGNTACDHFHLFKEDVQIMKQLGVKAYRFSISWPRIMPVGYGEVNEEGIVYYNALIDELVANDITPWVTLYHWDLPLALQLEKDGWLNPTIADDFAEYARVCFQHFGDRVKNWITMNEPWVVAILGYGQGVFAPGRISKDEPYLAAHQLLRAHAKAVNVYRTEFSDQQGKIGISNNCDWREPLTDSKEDKEAAERALEFFLAWFADPIYKGDYPEVMRSRLGNRLPLFDKEDESLLLGSTDFFGLNHYTTMFASESAGDLVKGGVHGNGGISEDQDVNLTIDPSWETTDMGWAIVPWGCFKLLNWIRERYDNPDVYITENGCAVADEKVDGEVNDQTRLSFYKEYIDACSDAIESGVNLKGYFAWSLMDNMEWAMGYTKRFGLVHVDFQTLERTIKASGIWYKKVISNNGTNN